MDASVRCAQGMLPRVSVVLPCRNAARWLPSTLRSLRQQEGVELELVVVDDGSTDRSLEVVRDGWHGAPWPMRVLHGDGRGVSAARNQGWEAASHPLVAFLDADDLAHPSRLRRQADCFVEDWELQQVLCGWRRIDHQGAVLTEVKPWQEGAGFSLEDAIRHKAVLPSAWMLRRSALAAVGGFDASLTQAEDVDLLLRLARSCAKGEWLCEVLCDYRVHEGGASQKVRAQAQTLTYVLERHLAALPASIEHQRLAADVRYGTRAWLGWYAWRSEDQALALELWRTALGLSPYPPGLTWVHIAENVLRSSQRIGEPVDIESLLASPLWQRLEQCWWAARNQPLLYLSNQHSPSLQWGLIYRGQWQAALQAWAQQFQDELRQASRVIPECTEIWWPTQMRELLPDGALNDLQQAVLDWSEKLLAWSLRGSVVLRCDSTMQELRLGLAAILRLWIQVVWPEDRRPATQRLEQLIALSPEQDALRALARAQKKQSSVGAEALERLARKGAFNPVASGVPDSTTLHLKQASWEDMHSPLDQCSGPQCRPCMNSYLGAWQSVDLPHNLVSWHAPDSNCLDTSSESHLCPEIRVLPMGQAWLRPPNQNPWKSTHAFAIADSRGQVLEDFSRRYPQPWPRSCPYSSISSEPTPDGKPHYVDATVVVAVGLSAETYYHWLLDVLPLIGRATQKISAQTGERVVVWHNGGKSQYVVETLKKFCGIDPDQCLDARETPWISAKNLVALRPLPFGASPAWVQDWIRFNVFGASHSSCSDQVRPRVLWLWRGIKGRRAVFGEAEAISQLSEFDIDVMDCSSLSVIEQAHRIANATLIIAPHGGAMANLVFASAGTKVLELHHPEYAPPYFHSLIARQKLQLFSQAQPASIAPALYRDLLFESSATEPIVLNPEAVAAAVRSIQLQ